VTFGLPFLVKFSIFLGEAKSKNGDVVAEKVLPPMTPRLILPFEATNSAQITITGVSDPGVTVQLLKNDVAVQKTTVAEDGSFVFTAVDLDKGTNSFNAIAVADKGGNSEETKPLVVLYDDQLPDLALENPKTDISTIDKSSIDILGTTEKGASVIVNNQVAMVDDSGKFKIRIQLSMGKNEVIITAEDTAGNVTKKTLNITYDI
jgi:bacillopeptidase F